MRGLKSSDFRASRLQDGEIIELVQSLADLHGGRGG
jgi:hypothetical protein